MDHGQLTINDGLSSITYRQIKYAPGPFAGRGGVSWCHLLSSPSATLACAVTGASRLSYNRLKPYSCESNFPSTKLRARVKWISLSARPPRTDRRLSERLDKYLSSRCFV